VIVSMLVPYTGIVHDAKAPKMLDNAQARPKPADGKKTKGRNCRKAKPSVLGEYIHQQRNSHKAGCQPRARKNGKQRRVMENTISIEIRSSATLMLS